MTLNHVYLIIAIVTEVVGTSAIKSSVGFTKLWPSLIVILGYGLSFYYLALALRSFPIGVTYAIWSGVGIVLITLIGFLWHKETPNLPDLIGMGFIITGVLVIHLFSQSL